MRIVWALALCAILVACGADKSVDEISVRLVDVFETSAVTGATEPGPAPEPTIWSFAEGELGGREDGRWNAIRGVNGLGVRDGRLVGRSTSDMPVVHLERQAGTGELDLLHSVEIRMRASAGSNLAIIFDGSEAPDESRTLDILGLFPWSATPIVTGDDATTYTLTGPFPADSASTRHIYLSPVDAAGATFEIESIRLIFRREHMAGFESGVGWQGLAEIYRETLVARSPETLHFDVDLPRQPFLEVALGTLEDGPLTFRIDIGAPAGGGPERSVSRTLTTSEKWEPLLIDLSDFGGRSVSLSLNLEAEESGTIGFWGSPAIRSRGALPPGEAGSNAGAPPQGVILVMVDTLRSDHLDAYGYHRPTAPNLSQLAETGTLFEDNISPATWTKVSTPSIMTSLYPSSHGVVEFPSRLPSSARTMAEIFRDAGYATVSYSSVLFTGKFSNLHQGFETVHEFTSVGSALSAKTARVYTDRFLPWIERHRDVPFFAFFHLFDPHDPYEPEKPYDTVWFDPAVREEHHHEEEAVRAVIDDPLRKAFLMPNREELVQAGIDAERFAARQIDWYDGSIRGFDAELGRLTERLEELGLRKRTLIVFVADHGEEFLEHGKTFHGHTVYGELTNVPLIMSWPGVIQEGVRVATTVQSIDILPTVLELAGLEAPGGMQGQSLVPLLRPAETGGSEDARFRPRPAISEQPVISDAGGNPPPFDKGSLSIVWNEWKLIHNHTGRGELPEFELYNHLEDPLNQRNVAEEHPDVVEELTRLLALAHSSALEARLAPDGEASEAMDQKELERLRALGYVQ